MTPWTRTNRALTMVHLRLAFQTSLVERSMRRAFRIFSDTDTGVGTGIELKDCLFINENE